MQRPPIPSSLDTKALTICLALVMALGVPTLLVFDSGPITSFYNEVIAYFGWGGLCYLIGKTSAVSFASAWTTLAGGARAFLVACILLAACIQFSVHHTGFPQGQALYSIWAVLGAALICIAGALAVAQPGGLDRFVLPFIWAIAIAAVANTVPALIEAFHPQWIDGRWIATAWSSDRISGNIRQPNLLATFSVWGIAAIVALFDSGRWKRALAWWFCAVLLMTIATSGSRIGAVEVIALAVWARVDRKLFLPARRLLWSAPLQLALYWGGLRLWSVWAATPHARAPDVTSGRLAMWKQSLALIAQQPWSGVGFGNFNFAWTLTPSNRSNPETFDNAHNLIIQWAVELGLPVAAILVALLVAAVVLAVRSTSKSVGIESGARRFCLVLVTMTFLHSLTEYPLWYVYFLFPVAFALGVAGASPKRLAEPAGHPVGVTAPPPQSRQILSLCGLLLALGASAATLDYQKVVTLYHPWDATQSREARVNAARKAVLFGVYADRAAGTLAVKGTRTLEPYKSATRKVLDLRLLAAWSLALNENGQTDKARYLAQRLHDFNDPLSRQFFAACSQVSTATARPFQCMAPTGTYRYSDFL